MKIDLTDTQWRDIQLCLLAAISNSKGDNAKIYLDSPMIARFYKTHDQIAVARENEKNKPKRNPYDPRKVKYYAKLGFYQQLHAADMMGYKSESTLVKYRKNGVLKENIHWIRTVGRGISYNPEKCKLAIRKAKLGY